MKLNELEATKIIKMVMGDKRALKDEVLLAKMLKKRLTKKEREVMNDLVNSVDKAVTMESLKADKERYDAILAGAIKKLKNESVHGDFFYSSGASE